MLAREAGVTMTPVHYRGGAPAIEDLLGGHIPASVNPVSEVIAYAKSNSIRILAVTGAERSAFLPDVPTMKQAGYNVVVESLTGVFLPAKTPEAIVGALSAAMRKATQSQTMIDSLARSAPSRRFSRLPSSRWIKAEIARWGPVVKAPASWRWTDLSRRNIRMKMAPALKTLD